MQIVVFLYRGLEQYTDTIYSTDINRKKRHCDQNEVNASKFPNLSLSEGEIRCCDGESTVNLMGLETRRRQLWACLRGSS